MVDKNQANYKIGNSAFFQLTILDFKDIEKKYKTNQELKKLVKASINKRVLEMKNKDDSRYSNTVNKLGEFNYGKAIICQGLFQSVQDYKAANLPKSEDYLVMNNLYKSCTIPQSEIFIDMSISVRANKNDIKTFDIRYLKQHISNIEASLLDKKLNKNLSSIIAN